MTSVSIAVEETPADSGDASTGGEKKPKSLTKGFEFGEFSCFLSFLMPLFCIILAIIEGSSYIWRPITVLLYILLFALGLFLLFGSLAGSSSEDKHSPFYTDDLAMVLLCVLAVIVGFSQFNRHVAILHGGFSADQTGYWHWMRFGVANFLEAALFDVPAIYEWNLTEIKPTTTTSRTVIFFFRTLAEILVVAELLRQLRNAWKFREKAKPNSATNYLSFMLPKMGSLIVVAMWGTPIAIGIGAMVNDGFSFASTWSAIRLGGPVLIGAWFAVHSLRGLGMSGWNKVAALGGIALGVILVRSYWPAFRLFLGQ
jgi:hypothetical protein